MAAPELVLLNVKVSSQKLIKALLIIIVLVYHFIGTGVFLHKQKRLSRAIDATEKDAQTLTACNKDTGEKRSLQSGAGVSGSV